MINKMITKTINEKKYFNIFQCVAGSVFHKCTEHLSLAQVRSKEGWLKVLECLDKHYKHLPEAEFHPEGPGMIFFNPEVVSLRIETASLLKHFSIILLKKTILVSRIFEKILKKHFFLPICLLERVTSLAALARFSN